MAYCIKCGTKKTDDGLCPNCPPDTSLPPLEPDAPPQIQQYQPIYHAPSAEPSPFVRDFTASLKKFFSPRPDDAVMLAANSDAPIWTLFGAINIILIALTVMFIGATGGTFGLILNNIFATGLLLGIFSFGISAFGTLAIFRINRINVPFNRALNIAGGASLILSAALAVSMLFSFFLWQASILIILTGAMGFFVLQYNAMIKIAQFNVSPFWQFLALHFINFIVFYIILVR